MHRPPTEQIQEQLEPSGLPFAFTLLLELAMVEILQGLRPLDQVPRCGSLLLQLGRIHRGLFSSGWAE
jgi:hypothetical protein